MLFTIHIPQFDTIPLSFIINDVRHYPRSPIAKIISLTRRSIIGSDCIDSYFDALSALL